MTREHPSKTTQRRAHPCFSGAEHFDVKGGHVGRVDPELRANDRAASDVKARTEFDKLNFDHVRPSTAAVSA